MQWVVSNAVTHHRHGCSGSLGFIAWRVRQIPADELIAVEVTCPELWSRWNLDPRVITGTDLLQRRLTWTLRFPFKVERPVPVRVGRSRVSGRLRSPLSRPGPIS